MNRRFFLKSLAACGVSAFAPSLGNMRSLYTPANAAVDYASVVVGAPAVMPQVINIFLYGGASELSGNLSNIADIELNSQNSYASSFGSGILRFDTNGDGTTDDGAGGTDPAFITRHGFWRGAGGNEMQFLLDQAYMSVYRSIYKEKDPTRSHRESILMSLKGSLDVNGSAGMGTRLASMLIQNRSLFESVPLADGMPVTNLTDPATMPLPFVSFEGETQAFAPEPDFSLPLQMRYLTMDEDFDNPYVRNANDHDVKLESIVAKVTDQQYRERFRKVTNAFSNRKTLEEIFGVLALGGANPTQQQDAAGNALPAIVGSGPAFDADLAQNGGLAQISYPDNRYSDRIRAAVTLAVNNPSSLYITVGGGLGGWDDHNNGIDRYPGRMQDLFEALRAAMLHIKYSGSQTAGVVGATRSTDNIIINVFGDFGRRSNLNNSFGWDHGNTQNLFTLGGEAVRPGTLGKVVGETQRLGDAGSNNQFLYPVDHDVPLVSAASYRAEPMSIASSVYSYFGAQNAQIMTADPGNNPAGDVPLDESQPGIDPLF